MHGVQGRLHQAKHLAPACEQNTTIMRLTKDFRNVSLLVLHNMVRTGVRQMDKANKAKQTLDVINDQ